MKHLLTVLKPIYKQKRMTVLILGISCPLFMVTPMSGFAHIKSCELADNTAKSIMAFNTCKADARAEGPSGHQEKETHEVLEDQIKRLSAENTILKKELYDVRDVLFQLLQRLTTK